MDKLADHLKCRVAELRNMKGEGRKIIGYTPGGYMPEELIYACDTMPVPVGLIKGGELKPVLLSGEYIPRWIDTFCRAQIGYFTSNDEPLYQIIDSLIVPITDTNIRSVADVLDFYTDIEVFRFGVPHAKTKTGLEYYLNGIKALKVKLEDITGAEITDQKLREAIELSNRERALLTAISSMRKAESPPISGKDFMELNHASFLADKKVMVKVLESLCTELKKKESPRPKGPRILLTGSTLAFGDYKVYELIEATGAMVVIEEFAEGIRHYWEKVHPDGDLMEALADRYFWRRVVPGWFRPGRERLDFLVQLVNDFNINGVIWYQLMYRDSYDIESYYFQDILMRETSVPMLKISSDYGSSETAPLKTRVEAFIETIR
ncbi:2-hydroxyacyl-CoA dehydratase subunit D [Chloroflexota bacterium]